MSDVSRLLDDLYSEGAPTRAPSWSSDEALDEAFASWVPGPADGASPAERKIVAGADDEVAVAPVPTVDAWLLDTAPELVFTETVTAARPRWTPSDDDILPASNRRRR